MLKVHNLTDNTLVEVDVTELTIFIFFYLLELKQDGSTDLCTKSNKTYL